MRDQKFIDTVSDPSFRIYGWSVSDILKVQRWLQSQNATVADLDGAFLDRNHYPRKRIQGMLEEDFR